MANIKSFYDKRVVHNFNELQGDLGKWGIFCLPVVAVKIARKYWSEPSFWLTSYCKEVLSDREYLAPDYAEMSGIFEALDEAIERGNMAFCEDILTELSGIKDAISNVSLSCNSGGGCGCGDIVYSTTEGGNTVSGDITQGHGESEGEGDPPEGFDSWAEYYAHKCKAANAIVDGWVSQLRQFSIMTVFTFTTTSAALGLFWAAFPPVAIGVLIFSLVALVGAYYVLGLLADNIETNRQSYVCALYNSKTAGEAIDNFMLLIDSSIDDLALAAPLPDAVKSVVNAMADASVFSSLYDLGLEFFYGDADCSPCQRCDYKIVLDDVLQPPELAKLLSGDLGAGTTGFVLESVLFTDQEYPEEVILFQVPESEDICGRSASLRLDSVNNWQVSPYYGGNHLMEWLNRSDVQKNLAPTVGLSIGVKENTILKVTGNGQGEGHFTITFTIIS